MDKLDMILHKLEKLDTMEVRLDQIDGRLEALEAGQHELHQITRAIRDRQDESDAKLEALTMDVHKIHGKVEALDEKFSRFQEEVRLGFIKYDRNIEAIARDLDRTIYHVEKLESLQSL